MAQIDKSWKHFELMVVRSRSMVEQLRRISNCILKLTITQDFIAGLIVPEVYVRQLQLMGYSEPEVESFINNMYTFIQNENQFRQFGKSD